MRKKIDDLSVYQKGRNLTKSIYELTNTNEQFMKDYSFKDQIRRACISIVSNIAEGIERDSKKEFAKFLGYSKGSAGEVRAQIIIASDIGYICQEEKDVLEEKCDEIIKMLSGLRKHYIQ